MNDIYSAAKVQAVVWLTDIDRVDRVVLCPAGAAPAGGGSSSQGGGAGQGAAGAAALLQVTRRGNSEGMYVVCMYLVPHGLAGTAASYSQPQVSGH